MSKKVDLISGASKKACLTFLVFVLPGKSVNPFPNCSTKRTILLPSNGVIIGRIIDTGDLQLNLGSTPQEEEEVLIYFHHSNR
jgi:hypothetical protein